MSDQRLTSRRGSSRWRSASLRITLIYAALAAAWVIVSDRLLLWLFPTQPELISDNQTIKGLAFIVLSAGLLYLLIERATHGRRRAEAALDRSQARFDLIVQGIDDYSICLLDTEAHIVSWNAGAERITGYRAEEVIGRSIDRLYTNDDRAEGLPSDLLRRAAEDGRATDRGWRLAKDGRRYLAEVTVTAIHDAQGRLEGYVNLVRDVTEQQVVAGELREAQERLALGLQSGDVGLWDWDIVNDTMFFSPEWKQQLGYADHELSNDRDLFWRFLHPDDMQRVKQQQVAALAPDHALYDLEVRLKHRDGGWRWIHTRGRVLRDRSGAMVRMIGVHTDVTERRHTEAQLRQALRMEAIGQLTGGVAHDFNNLLTVVLGNTELLRERLERDPAALQLAETTLAAAERGAALTRRLLAFARRETLTPERVEPNRLIGGLLPLLIRTLGEDIEIATDFGAPLWEVVVDPHQLENSLINLAVNARDALPDGGHVVIATRKRVLLSQLPVEEGGPETTTPPGDYVEILVADDGGGMPPEVVERAFEPFFTTKDVGKGSGLGLSMVYGFVRQSGGQVEMDSGVGRGTTVRLLLPRAKPVADGGRDDGDQPLALRGQGERVLVVEDDAAVRQLMAGLLRTLSYDVVEAADGPQAVEAAGRAGPFDLLVTDMVMPGGMNGAALANRLRIERPMLPALYVSGYSDRPLPGLALDGDNDPPPVEGPVDRNLGKPFTRRALARAVRRTLDAAKVPVG